MLSRLSQPSGKNFVPHARHEYFRDKYSVMCLFTPSRKNFRSTMRRRTLFLVGLILLLPQWVQRSHVISICLFGFDDVAFRLFRFLIRASFLSVRTNTRSRW